LRNFVLKDRVITLVNVVSIYVATSIVLFAMHISHAGSLWHFNGDWDDIAYKSLMLAEVLFLVPIFIGNSFDRIIALLGIFYCHGGGWLIDVYISDHWL
jgi:hypothetical protein